MLRTSGFVDDVMFARNRPGKGDWSGVCTQSDSPGAARIRYGRKYSAAADECSSDKSAGVKSDVYDFFVHSCSIHAAASCG